MTCSTSEKSEGLAMLNEACTVIETTIKKSGGNFAIQVSWFAEQLFLFFLFFSFFKLLFYLNNNGWSKLFIIKVYWFIR